MNTPRIVSSYSTASGGRLEVGHPLFFSPFRPLAACKRHITARGRFRLGYACTRIQRTLCARRSGDSSSTNFPDEIVGEYFHLEQGKLLLFFKHWIS
ncbi:hypothetical protein QN277_017445 [Acacia crassicarpa]|uniref:Uncharacterized protein n=1 Tax=Acacia crassicarpa TaxID=499986 RepID=A0AAE1MN85_9FABA|nr:hypothetical protein QN277_017445 [Acacia crassicarpa]